MCCRKACLLPAGGENVFVVTILCDNHFLIPTMSSKKLKSQSLVPLRDSLQLPVLVTDACTVAGENVTVLGTAQRQPSASCPCYICNYSCRG